MRRKLSLCCLLVAWLCANGAIWNVVQVIGWSKMYHDFAQVMPVAQALQLTFDGSAPCDLCHLAQKGQEATRDSQPPAALGGGLEKILLIADAAPVSVLIAPEVVWPVIAGTTALSRADSVPVPPPRV